MQEYSNNSVFAGSQRQVDEWKDRYEELKTEHEALSAKYEALVQEIQNMSPTAEDAPKEMKISDYKVGAFVQVLPKTNADWIDGRVLFKEKSHLIIGTPRGEFTVGSPNMIKLQGTE